ncbi:hypothetical protein [Lysobacter arvi]|uniref:Type II secretion system protein M n=1 Tax=Lysobacter arvi TaxID=3038776 RepID=A0ABU1CED0_9GAMM|nr:hypothetical protein [Lysobacter arvi]MDR0182585.1 hypothetical protein [Lysobacter arvi]
MNRTVWQLQRARWRLGTIGVLAVVVLLFAVVVALVEIAPLQRDIAHRRADLEQRSAVIAHPPPPQPEQATDPGSADDRFSVFLHSFHAIAKKNGLDIPQVVYQPAGADAAPVRRYLLEATFNTTYPQFRVFLQDLRRLPGVRVEHLAVSRGDIGSTQLEIRMQCSFLVEVPA